MRIGTVAFVLSFISAVAYVGASEGIRNFGAFIAKALAKLAGLGW
jgi:hypothetical protein